VQNLPEIEGQLKGSGVCLLALACIAKLRRVSFMNSFFMISNV
jgi:hypothetical protein